MNPAEFTAKLEFDLVQIIRQIQIYRAAQKALLERVERLRKKKKRRK